MIICFSRTIDFLGLHGVTGLYAAAAQQERQALRDRIGPCNLLEQAAAVDYYELDLVLPEHRAVAQVRR
jgi:hypothetical protein